MIKSKKYWEDVANTYHILAREDLSCALMNAYQLGRISFISKLRRWNLNKKNKSNNKIGE